MEGARTWNQTCSPGWAGQGRTGTGALNSDGVQCSQQEVLSRRQGHRQQAAGERAQRKWETPLGSRDQQLGHLGVVIRKNKFIENTTKAVQRQAKEQRKYLQCLYLMNDSYLGYLRSCFK